MGSTNNEFLEIFFCFFSRVYPFLGEKSILIQIFKRFAIVTTRCAFCAKRGKFSRKNPLLSYPVAQLVVGEGLGC